MEDPLFETLVSDIRGFDLGDDDELHSALDERATADPSAMDGEDWLLRAVLRIRQEKWGPALEDLEQALHVGEGTSPVHYLRSRVLSRMANSALAGEALDAAERAAAGDGRLSDADLSHGRALLEWDAARPDDALVHLRHGLSMDSTRPLRWRAMAELLLELSRTDEACEALDRTLALAPADDGAMVLYAVAEASRGGVHAAARWVERALHVDPSLREALYEDPRLAAVRDDPELARRLRPPAAVDPSWLDDTVPWLTALRSGASFTAGMPSLDWLGEDEARRLHARIVADHEDGAPGTMHSSATLEHSQGLLARRTPIAWGPGTYTREGTLERSLVWVDREASEGGLWLALSTAYPPFLWIGAGRTATTLRAAIDEASPRASPRRAGLTRHTRGFLGYRERVAVPDPYSGELLSAGEDELDAYFAMNPFLESQGWGSALPEDPWPDHIPEQPGILLKIEAHRRQVAEQARGAVWSMTRRLRHSRGTLAIERHGDDMFVAAVRYRPAPHGAVVGRVNEAFGTEYPQDLPIDAVGALLGFSFDGPDDLEAALRASSDPGEKAGLLLVIAALRHSDLDLQGLLGEFIGHPDPLLRATVCNVAIAYNYEWMLEAMSATERDPELLAQIEEMLDEGIPVAEPDEYDDDDDEEALDLEEEDLEELDGTEVESDDGVPSYVEDADAFVDDAAGGNELVPYDPSEKLLGVVLEEFSPTPKAPQAAEPGDAEREEDTP